MSSAGWIRRFGLAKAKRRIEAKLLSTGGVADDGKLSVITRARGPRPRLGPNGRSDVMVEGRRVTWQQLFGVCYEVHVMRFNMVHSVTWYVMVEEI